MKKLLVASLMTIALLSSCGTATNQPTASPTATATATVQPTASPSPAPTALGGHELVYFGRDRLPPVAAKVNGSGTGATAEARVLSRLAALFTAQPPRGLFNTTLSVKARPAAAKIDGDLVTVDFNVPGGDWGTAGSAGTKAFIQQIVYTASEEPGIRRVLITENGHQAIVGGEGVVIDHAATREDIAGYTAKASTDGMTMGGATASLALTSTYTVDETAPGLVRFIVDTGLRGEAAKGGMAFTLRPRENVEAEGQLLGKWAFVIDVPNATASLGTRETVPSYTPLRMERTSAQSGGIRYELGLDDLRPWRAAILYEPLRLVLDIGGDPDAVSANIAVYQPRFGASVQPGFTASGLIRAFEARYEYIVRDNAGTVLVDDFANASLGTSEFWGAFELKIAAVPAAGGTLTLQLRSPKDGSVSEAVQVPISR